MDGLTVALDGEWLFKGFIGEDWLLRNAHFAETKDRRGWRPAAVPGSVQHDLWQAGMIPDPYVERNSLQIEWTADRTWLYKKTFTTDPAWRGSRVLLVFEGVDYTARYYLNDELLGRSMGMFIPTQFEIGDRLKDTGENSLCVVIDPAPFEQPQIGYTSQVYTQKTRMNYWWDFCPRMVHQGIWQPVYLRITGPARVEDVCVRPVLADDFASAEIGVTVRLNLPDSTAAVVDVILRSAGEDDLIGQAVLNLDADQPEGEVKLILDHPDLWWPNEAGDQPLYEVETRVSVDGQPSDCKLVTTGIRRIEFVANDGSDETDLPYALVVNGRKLFIRGWNWVPMDVLYGVDQPEKRERLLRLARGAHVNLLRIWGGGLIETEAFYNLCDRLGLLVWQEFIQSSSGIDNFPSDDPRFIEFLTQNAVQAVRARRNHPALAVWCGGNELHYTPNNLVDNRHPALAALQAAVEQLDPGRHWVPSSPAGGTFSFGIPQSAEDHRLMQDVHGPWEYQGLREQYTLYNQGASHLHSEFGVEGITNLRTLNRTISPERQWPVSLENPVWDHLGAWWVKERVWDAVFGPFKDVEAAQRGTQFIQADGLRYALEADRRRMYQNGGTMPWQFNEPYPMAACTSAVDYYAEPKPVYYAVARAYQSLALSARFKTLAWGGEPTFEAEIWVSNLNGEQDGDLSVQIVDLDGRFVFDHNTRVICASNQSMVLDSVNLALDRVKDNLFFLDLALWDTEGDLLTANRYLFSKTENLAVLVNGSLLPAIIKPRVEKAGKTWKITLENPSNQAALWVWLEADKPDLRSAGYAYFEDNYFCLLPGEQRVISVRWSGMPEGSRVIRISGWNFQTVKVV